MAVANFPFYANPDDTHCFQACLRMVLKHFRPTTELSYVQLDRLSGKREGKWTWPLRAIGELFKLGFEIEIVDDFDNEQFIAYPETYLFQRYGAEAATEQIKNSDIPYEVEVARQFSHLAGKPKIPTVENLRDYERRGFRSICCINLSVLHGYTGYYGHFVVPVSVGASSIVIHDPGGACDRFPPQPYLELPLETFQQSWQTDRFVVALKDSQNTLNI